jgi:hypothetical protein
MADFDSIVYTDGNEYRYITTDRNTFIDPWDDNSWNDITVTSSNSFEYTLYQDKNEIGINPFPERIYTLKRHKFNVKKYERKYQISMTFPGATQTASFNYQPYQHTYTDASTSYFHWEPDSEKADDKNNTWVKYAQDWINREAKR